MSIEILSKNLFQKAQKEIEFLEKNLEKECGELEREFNERISKFKDDLSRKQDLEIKLIKTKILGNSKKKVKQIILETKSNLIEEVLNRVLGELNNLKPDQRKELYNSLLDRYGDLFEFDLIKCSKKDHKIFKDLISEKFPNKSIKIVKDDSINGFELHKGDLEKIDLRFETIIDQIFNKNEEELQKVLFRGS